MTYYVAIRGSQYVIRRRIEGQDPLFDPVLEAFGTRPKAESACESLNALSQKAGIEVTGHFKLRS